jgi:hypothetical protein
MFEITREIVDEFLLNLLKLCGLYEDIETVVADYRCPVRKVIRNEDAEEYEKSVEESKQNISAFLDYLNKTGTKPSLDISQFVRLCSNYIDKREDGVMASGD